MIKIIINVVVLLICLQATISCGRKGRLEPAPSSMIEDSSGKMVEKPKIDKPFILDRLIAP